MAKEGFSQVAYVHISLDGPVLKNLHEEVINNIINSIILQLIVTVLAVGPPSIVLSAAQFKYLYRTTNIMS